MLRTQGSHRLISHTLQRLLLGWLGLTSSQVDCTSLCCPGMTQGSLGELQGGKQAPAGAFVALGRLEPAILPPSVPRSHWHRRRDATNRTPSGTRKGELLLTWDISVSHAEAKPEPMEMPVTLITWRRETRDLGCKAG